MKCLCCRDINNVEYAPKGDAMEISELKCSRNMGGRGRGPEKQHRPGPSTGKNDSSLPGYECHIVKDKILPGEKRRRKIKKNSFGPWPRWNFLR